MIKPRLKLRGERGQVLLAASLLLTTLIGMLGLVHDAGKFYVDRRATQNAADAGAVASAIALASGATADQAKAAGIDTTSGNGYLDSEPDEAVQVHIPPLSGEFAGDALYTEVIIDAEPGTIFLHTLLDTTGSVRGRGVARSVQSQELYAIFVKASGCGVSDALKISGSDVDVVGAVHSNSNAEVSGSNDSFDGELTYSCSFTNGGGGNSYNPAPAQSGQRSYPISYVYEDFPCTMEFTSDTDLNSVNSVWVGNNPSSKTLKPGVYCSTQKLSLSGQDVQGNVTLVARGEISISGSDFDLTPYWKDVLIFSASGSSSALDISGSGGSWEGIMMAPNGVAKVQGSDNLSVASSIMADRVLVSGSDFSLTAMYYGQGPRDVALVE